MDASKLVDEETIENAIDYESLVPSIQDAFRAYYNGEATMPPKDYIDIEKHNGDFRSMPAYIDSEKQEASGIKWVNVHPENDELPTVMAVVIYNDPKTGFPLAVMNGTVITKLRTGAAAGVATNVLAKDDINDVGIVGAGVQSYEQVRAIESVRDFNNILVSDPDESAIQEFRRKFDDKYNITQHDPDTVAENVDVLSTTTPVEEPIISSVGDGVHINAMGADAHNKQEFVYSVFDNSMVFVDDMNQALHSGEVSQAYEDGYLTDDDIEGSLGEVVSNGLDYSDKTTMFDSTGLAIQDVATAHLVYESIDEKPEVDLFNFV